MLDAWGRMARRLESLTLDKVERLTLGTTVMMWEVRLETRRAAWSLVQDYGAKCDVKAISASQSIALEFASELADIEVRALNYASIQPNLDKGKKPAVDHGDTEEEEIPDSALEPMPQGSSKYLFDESLQLRRRIKELEQELKKNVDPTLDKQLRKALRRDRLTAQKWFTLAAGSSLPESTLSVLNDTSFGTLIVTLRNIITKLVLKNADKLSLDGSHLAAIKWIALKSIIINLNASPSSGCIEIRINNNSKTIDLILPVSES